LTSHEKREAHNPCGVKRNSSAAAILTERYSLNPAWMPHAHFSRGAHEREIGEAGSHPGVT